MNDTHLLKLPYILAAQSQKHVTHNEALRKLDALVHLSVSDRDLATPPGAPADGDRYIVAAPATGAWAGKENQIAAWQDGAWAFFPANEGWIAWVEDEDLLVAWDGTSWITAGGGGATSLNPAAGGLIGINATADSTNRLAVSSPATLFNHAGNGHQQKINKNAFGDTASQLYQTNFSGRAEVGLTGDDDFHFKVSPNGSTFHEAIKINRNDGTVQIPKRLHQNGDYLDFVTTTILDDSVFVYNMPDGSPRMAFVLMHNNAFHGLVRNVGTSISYIYEMSRYGTDIVIGSKQVYTGTTGTDGKFTVATDEANMGRIYFENRLAGARVMSLIFLG